MKKLLLAYLSIGLLAGCTGGYSLTGGDVGDAKTVSISFFRNDADLVQPQLSQIFTEALRDIFIQQTNLRLIEQNGDMSFEGSIADYRVEPINVQADNLGSVAQNRLTVTVNVIFTNKLEPTKSFEQRFSRFADFDADVDLSIAEEELLDQITSELSENVLNHAIGNW